MKLYWALKNRQNHLLICNSYGIPVMFHTRQEARDYVKIWGFNSKPRLVKVAIIIDSYSQ